MKSIQIGETFTHKHGNATDTFRREPDAINAAFECERIRITHLSHSMQPNWKPYTFGAEPEWFKQRSMEVAS